MLKKIAEVLINRPSKHLNRTFSYLVPKEKEMVDRGWFVIVPFAHRMEEGIVLSVRMIDTEQLPYQLLPIAAVPNSFAWFTPEMMRLAYWISSYYMCTLLDALRLFLIDKKGIKMTLEYMIRWDRIPQDSRIRGIIDSSVPSIREEDAKLLFSPEQIHQLLNQGIFVNHELVKIIHKKSVEPWLSFIAADKNGQLSRSPKQSSLLKWMEEKREMPLMEIRHKGYSSSMILGLVNKGFCKLIYKRKRTYSLVSDPDTEGDSSFSGKTLTDEQIRAVNTICQAVDEKKYKGILLKGVTGSGKTEVYLRAVEHAVSEGGSALILVPEIALTGQMVDYFSKRFGSKVAFIHSGLSKGERYNNRLRTLYKESRVIIGSRSALFLPFSDLRLIVVDEEYDSSYKQDQTPRYNGRDVAKEMAVIYHCPIVLGAATPAISTYFAAKEHKIDLLTMNHRIFNTPMPAVHIVDMRNERDEGNYSIFSRPLTALLQQTLRHHKKAILLLNRRGYATTLMCRDCGYVFKCPHCDISLVYHKGSHKLRCHYCESSYPVPDRCPKCGSSHILYLGSGTEKIEEELHDLFPSARARRFDLDSTQRKNESRHILDQFRNGDIDILFGTQMVAKGLDIPDVQTVGILSADSTLNLPTYLASQQAFNLITQCAGRAGRQKEQGQVILQTYNPDHYVIQAAARQDYDAFYEKEISYRKALRYPPFQRLMKITFFSSSYQVASRRSKEMYSYIRSILPELKDFHVECTPPFDEPIRKLRDRYQVSIMVRGDTLKDLKLILRNSILFNRNGIIIDVDPL